MAVQILSVLERRLILQSQNEECSHAIARWNRKRIKICLQKGYLSSQAKPYRENFVLTRLIVLIPTGHQTSRFSSPIPPKHRPSSTQHAPPNTPLNHHPAPPSYARCQHRPLQSNQKIRNILRLQRCEASHARFAVWGDWKRYAHWYLLIVIAACGLRSNFKSGVWNCG